MDGDWEAPLVENPRCKEAPGCGPWSAPMIDNPAYKGVWRPPLIENPLYKGIWKPRKIKNPEYFEEVMTNGYTWAKGHAVLFLHLSLFRIWKKNLLTLFKLSTLITFENMYT